MKLVRSLYQGAQDKIQGSYLQKCLVHDDNPDFDENDIALDENGNVGALPRSDVFSHDAEIRQAIKRVEVMTSHLSKGVEDEEEQVPRDPSTAQWNKLYQASFERSIPDMLALKLRGFTDDQIIDMYPAISAGNVKRILDTKENNEGKVTPKVNAFRGETRVIECFENGLVSDAQYLSLLRARFLWKYDADVRRLEVQKGKTARVWIEFENRGRRHPRSWLRNSPNRRHDLCLQGRLARQSLETAGPLHQPKTGRSKHQKHANPRGRQEEGAVASRGDH